MADEAQTEGKIEGKIEGWEDIARETGRSINRSVCVRSAQRYAQPGRDNRLPVFFWPDGTVFMRRTHLRLWAAAWLDPLPVNVVPAPVKKRPARALTA